MCLPYSNCSPTDGNESTVPVQVGRKIAPGGARTLDVCLPYSDCSPTDGNESTVPVQVGRKIAPGGARTLDMRLIRPPL
jgi:hypothetical protein